MKCSQVQPLLSAYHDGELPSSDAAAVSQHVATCSACQAVLDNFRQMSRLAGVLRLPIGSEPHQLERAKLAEARPTRFQTRWAVATALAAAILIAVSVPVWLHNQTGRPDAAGQPVALRFDAFLQQLSRDSSSAQNVLLASFNGRQVDSREIQRTLGYTPVAGDAVPEGYMVNGVYLLEMPQCNCANADCGMAGKCHCGGTCACSQVVFRSAAGRTLSVFEYDGPNSGWFGELPAIRCQCNGVSTELVQIDAQQLAATWKHGDRYVTLVGAQNLEEVKDVMEHLQANSSLGLETPIDTKAS